MIITKETIAHYLLGRGLLTFDSVVDGDLLVPVSGGGLIAGSATAAKHLRPSIVVCISDAARPQYSYDEFV